MPQKLNLMKEEMDFFHFFHEANGQPKALNSIYVPIYVSKDSWKAFAKIRRKKCISENPLEPSTHKFGNEVQARQQLSVFESLQMVDSKRRKKGQKIASPFTSRMTRTQKSTLRASSYAQNSAIQAKNEGTRITALGTESMLLQSHKDNIRFQNGLQNGFVYFNGFAINNWIMIYLIRVGLSNKFIHNHLTTIVDSAKSQGIPLGMPSKHFVISLKSDGNKIAEETKDEIVEVLTTSSYEKVQIAMMYAPNNVDLEELLPEITPMYSFRIITGYFVDNYGLTGILQGLRSFVKEHKKLPVMGIATRIHDGHLIIARCQNQLKTGAKFDVQGFCGLKLTIIRDSQWNEQLVSIVKDYLRNKSLEKLVIYRSHESSSCCPVSYQNEYLGFQKLMEQSGIRFTFVVAKEIVSGSNQPIFEKVVDGIGFTDEEMTQLTAELSFNSQIKQIPAPLAMAQMYIARMVVHYDGFTQSDNYELVAQVKKGFDKKAYKTIKKYLKSSFSVKIKTEIKSKKMKGTVVVASEQNADQMENLNQGLNQKANKIVNNDDGSNMTKKDDSGSKEEKKDEHKTGLSKRVPSKSTSLASDPNNPQSSATNVENEDPEVTIYKSGLQNGFVYFYGFAIKKWIMIYLNRESLSNDFIHNHLTTMMDLAKSQGIPLGMPSKHFVVLMKSDGKKLAQETKDEIDQVLTTSSYEKVQMAMMYAPNKIDLKELQLEMKPMYNFRIITGYFGANYKTTAILKKLLSFVKEHEKLPVIGIASRIHDGQWMLARCHNQPKTGAKFDEPSLDCLMLTIVPDNKFNEQLVSIVRDYTKKNKDLENLVIYRSVTSTSGGPVSYLEEVSDVQKLLEQSKIRITYVVAKETVKGSNQPIFEKVVDGIGFTNEELSQLTAELSFHSQMKRIPAPLAMAQMYIARMVVHYDGFKQLKNYKQVAQVKGRFDKEAYNAVKKYLKSYFSAKAKTAIKSKKMKGTVMVTSEQNADQIENINHNSNKVVKTCPKSSLSDTKAQSKIKSKKKKTKVSCKQKTDQMKDINQGLNQKTNKVVNNDVEMNFAYSGASGFLPELNSNEEAESGTDFDQIHADDGQNVTKEEDNGLKEGKAKDKQKTELSGRRTATKSTLVSSDAIRSAINVENEDPVYENGLQNGFIYFNGFAINTWIMIYLVRVGSSNKFIHKHLNALLESTKSKGIPLGMPSKHFVLSLKSDGNKILQETKKEIVQVLTTSSHKKVQMAVIYAPNDIHLEELIPEITPMFNFRIITQTNSGLTGILKSLLSFVKEHKKLRVMGIVTRIHDGQLMIARTVNNPETGAKFEVNGFYGIKLTVSPENQLNEQLMSIVRKYVKNRSFEKLVIYRSHESSSGRSVSHQNEVFDIQKLMEQSGTRFTYLVVKEIVSGSNQPNFEKVVDGIGFTDEEMTQLTAELSFHSQMKRIPAPLAMAQMYIARMVVHYDGFKQLKNYNIVAQVKKGLDKEAYNVVKKYLESSL